MNKPLVSNEIEKVRGILLTLIRRHRPHVKWTRKAPTVWQPTTVIDPRPNQFHRNFTELTCWEYIEELLASRHEIEIVNMQKPPGSKGYVMKVE